MPSSDHPAALLQPKKHFYQWPSVLIPLRRVPKLILSTDMASRHHFLLLWSHIRRLYLSPVLLVSSLRPAYHYTRT